MNVLERKDITYKLNNLPPLKSLAFIWNGKHGYTGSIFKRTIKSTMHIYKHYGIFYGCDYSDTLLVLENNQNGIECVSYNDFMAGHTIFSVDYFVFNPNKIADILNRANERNGLSYDSRRNNCEHFVNYCVHGLAKSMQSETTEKLVDILITFPEISLMLETDKQRFEVLLKSADRLRANMELPREAYAQKMVDEKKKQMGIGKKPAKKPLNSKLREPKNKPLHVTPKKPKT
ncbi:MAG TPA: lecithin retinol acyltransferase family protein [Bacteroidia bacterium]|jgi:hypothetical protein|nr:lecithin retinol acyltransferase family protein [Bacteroidia bacterium]